MRSVKNIIQHELIGLNVRVLNPTNKANKGICGKIVDETKHTLLIKQGNEEKRIFKKCVNLEFQINSKTANIHGSELTGKPWNRVKNK